MDDASQSAESSSEKKQVGMHITSDPDRTEVEQPETFGAREIPSLPFRILLVSDLAPQAAGPDDWSAGSHVHRVDANSFAAFMDEMAPRLDVEVPNRLGETPKNLEVELQFSELGAFHPEQVARQVPVLAQLLDVRALVQAVGNGEMDLDTFRDRLDGIGVDIDWAEDLYQTLAGSEESSDPPPSQPASGEDDESLDRLLGMVDVGAEEPTGEEKGTDMEDNLAASNGDVGSSKFVDALMGAVSGADASAEAEASAVKSLLATLEAALARQVKAILEHPDVRQLEAAWRGLRFLVDRLNFREDVQLMVLPVGREELHEAMYYQVIVPEHSEDRAEPPLSLVLLDIDFGRGHRNIEQLTDLAETGESLQTPVVASVSSDFFGVEKISGLARLPALRPHLQGSEYVEWEALRKEEAAQFLGLALPSFLLRYPYGPDQPVEAFDLEEEEGLWGSGALAVGVIAARSFVDTGWPTHLGDYDVGNLPVQPGRGGRSPLAALLPGSKQSELARSGFVVLGGRSNHDAIRIMHAPTVRKPETYDDPAAMAEARAHASLPCRLFVARAAHYLLTLQDNVPVGASVDVVQREIAGAMRSFLGVTEADAEDKRVTVEHVTNVDLPEHELLAVRLRPPSAVLDREVRLVMGLQVEKEAQPESDDG